ncbi:MAG: enoyl-CoA hydratase/isomerase family protein, partial [Mycobacteriales bacterium]
MTDLLTQRDGTVLRLLINREDKRNALSADVMRGMLEAVTAASPDDEVRVIVVSSVGDRIFCAGADLAVMANDATGLEQHEGRGLLARLVIAMRECPVPIVARVQGMCLAGGIGLAAGADVVLARESAQFGMPEVDRGLWPFMVSALLARHMSPKHAVDRMLAGDRFDARTAYEMGLVSRVFPDDSFDADVEAYVAKLAAAAPVAVRLGKAAWVTATETESLAIAL